MSTVNNNIINKLTRYMLHLFLFLYSFLLCGCSDSETNKTLPSNWIDISIDNIEFTYQGGIVGRSFALAKDLSASKISYSLDNRGDEWCTVLTDENKITIRAEHSYSQSSRSTNLIMSYDDEHKLTIPIFQNDAPTQEDTLIKVIKAEATSEEKNSMDSDGNPLTLAMSYDGNKSTYYNSKFGAISYPFYITYQLEEGHALNRIVYAPRTDNGNQWGSFDKFTVEVSTYDKPDEYTIIGAYERGDGVSTPFSIDLKEGITNAKMVRFTITKAYKDRVSCAEMEFYEMSKNKFDPTTLFSDKMFTTLKEGVTEKQIRQTPDERLKQLGLALLSKKYDASFRLADYRPFQSPEIMASRNKTSKYSLRDNPTGIYAKANDTLSIIVGPIYNGGEISILIQDLNGGYNNYKKYILREGYNQIITEVGGLIYILNHVKDDIPLIPKTNSDKAIINTKTISVHFVMGKVNGYFDIQKNKESDWNKILNNATYQDIDVLGKYAHITWRISDFKKYETNIIESITNFDNLVYLEEEFMGLVKYNKMFNNRMHFCIDYKASSPNASDYRTVYNASDYYAEPFCKPFAFPTRCWGPAHEAGHCNQTRPGFKWAGMTEVTNNIMSLWVQTSLGQNCKLLVDGGKGSYKNYYEWATDYIINEKRAHCLPDVANANRELQLVPFWQLKLYMIDALGKKDFYHDLYEHYRVTDNLGTSAFTDGIIQLDFVRQVCALSGLNMLDFFEKWGFLSPVNTILNDYSQKTFIITQEQINMLKDEINSKSYTTPHKDVSQITETNMILYKEN